MTTEALNAALAALLAALPPVLRFEVSTGLALLVAFVLAVGMWARGRRR